VNLIMALAGWLAYYLSNSQALFLDGNFSFLMFISMFIAIKVSAIKMKKTEIFPYGQFIYESLYSLLKGLMISGVLLVTFVQNSSAIFHFLNGQKTQPLETGIIFFYSVFMVILCFGTALFYKLQNKKTNNSSTILTAEYSASIVDGFMSAGIGTALVAIRYIDIVGYFSFLHYIGDSLLVLLLCLLLGKGPILLIKNSFIELAGGTLQDSATKKDIEGILTTYLQQDSLITGSYISKTGSSYLVVAYLNTPSIGRLGIDHVQQLVEQIRADLQKHYPTISFEAVLSQQSANQS